MPALAPDTLLDGRPPLAALLGLVEDEAVGLRSAVRLEQFGAAWPAAAVALAGAAAAVAVITGGSTATLVGGALLAAIAAALPIALHLFRNAALHARVRIAALGATLVAIPLPALLWAAARLPGEEMRLVCVLALGAAVALAVAAIQPVRAAALGFGVGLVGALIPQAGIAWPLLVGPCFIATLAVATARLALLDHRNAALQAAQVGEGRVAAKMIAEFEDHGTGWFWEADRHGRLTYLSTKVATEIARHAAEPVGRSLVEVFRMDADAPGTERTLAFHLSSRTSFSDFSVCAASGGDRWWSMSGRPIVDDLGRFCGFIGSGTDLTEKRRSDAEITRLALYDGLTGLANRQRMRAALDKSLVQATGQHRPVSLFLMDLDRFKAVNDTLGHQAGDALLSQVGQRLTRVVGAEGLVGRLGGDEFQVLLPDLDHRDTLSTLACELIASLSQPYFVGGASVTIGCSIGIAIAPDHGGDSETLVRNADLALYAAKADGRGVHRFYSDDMLAGAKKRQQLEDDLRHALATGGFHLAYQPVVGTADERIVGFEALVRWDHPTRGPVSPADFIPVAEECGLIEALGEWVLRTACIEAAAWPREVRVAVNVSPIQFANPRLPSLVTSALARAGLPAHRLELEITEGVFLDESSSSDAMFAALKGLGVRLALDDFGTGYSSLGYLRTAPFDKIKIDQSFVRGAAQPGNRNAAIIRAIVTLADTLGMDTTAEGVEIQDEIRLVRELGCSHIQGYVYGRPMPTADATALLTANGGSAVASGFKVSRSPRTRVLRAARIAIDGVEGDVRIRDISTGGAMIDGIDIDGHPVGLDLLIELVEDQMFAAQVRWAEEGRAGVQFAQPFDLELLATPAAPRLRRAG